MNDAYKDCPVRTSEYTIDGKKYIVKSHFVGAKELNDVLYRIAFEQAMDEVLKRHKITESYEKRLAKFGVMRYNSNVEFGCFV